MTNSQSSRELLVKWQAAERLAQDGDTSALIKILRDLYLPYEVPDLWFIADLLEGKFRKAKGRPSKKPINAGLDQLLAAETVLYILRDECTTQEKAFAKAAELLPMSESAIKQHYLQASKNGFKEQLFFEERIKGLLRSVKTNK
jgi:hypothetical protein